MRDYFLNLEFYTRTDFVRLLEVAVYNSKMSAKNYTLLDLLSGMKGAVPTKPLARWSPDADDLQFLRSSRARRAPNRAEGAPMPGGQKGTTAPASKGFFRDVMPDEAYPAQQNAPPAAAGLEWMQEWETLFYSHAGRRESVHADVELSSKLALGAYATICDCKWCGCRTMEEVKVDGLIVTRDVVVVDSPSRIFLASIPISRQ